MFMDQLDDNFLINLGFGGLPFAERQALLMHVFEELQVRLGIAIEKDLTDQQLDEFSEIVKTADRQKSVAWLEEHCPNYKETSTKVMEDLKKELADKREIILGEFKTA